MKILLKIGIVLLFSNYSFSQLYYSHYLDETSEWRVIEHRGEASFHDFYFETIFFDGFEDIDGYTYYKMYMTFYNIGYDISYTEIIFPQSNNYTQFIGYFREDAFGKFYLKYQNQNEFVYFDNQVLLDSQVGGNYFAEFPSSNNSCPIATTENIQISGINSKMIHSSSGLGQGGSALEGVGILFNYCLQPQSLDYTLATFKRTASYKKQGETHEFFNYQITINSIEPLYDYSFPPAIHQNLNSTQLNSFKVQLYPNPTTSGVNFDNSKSSFTTVTVCNALGQAIKQQSLGYSSNEKVDLLNLSNGIYFLKFANSNNENTTIKVIKQ